MKKILGILLSLSIVFNLSAQTISTFIAQTGINFEAITWAEDGRIFSVDYVDGDIYKIDAEGNFNSLGTYSTPLGGAMDAAGNFYFSELNTGKVHRVDIDDVVTEYASGLIGPAGILVDDENNLMYVANYSGNSISVIDMSVANPSPTTLASGNGINGPDGLVFSPDGDIISANFNNNKVNKITPTGEVSTFATLTGSVGSGYLIPWEGGYMITGAGGHGLFSISATGEVEQISGTGGLGYEDGNLEDARFNLPNGIAISPSQDSILITESSAFGRIRLLTFEDMISNIFEEKISVRNIEISPNPASENLHIVFQTEENGKVEISLLDMKGTIVDSLFSGSLNNGNFDQTFMINQKLAAGTYLLQISFNGKIYSRKLVF